MCYKKERITVPWECRLKLVKVIVRGEECVCVREREGGRKREYLNLALHEVEFAKQKKGSRIEWREGREDGGA